MHGSILVGDIGGTNARLAIWQQSADGNDHEVFAKTYPTSAFPSFDATMSQFLSEKEVSCNLPYSAAIAVAGAVKDNRCKMTNISWEVDGLALQAAHGFKVAVLNDFEAVGYGIPTLDDQSLVALNPGAEPVRPEGPKVVMGPGTGLGAAQLIWQGGAGYRVIPGEGSHATFAPRGWKQSALATFVTQKLGHCEIEQVACGSGLELIYSFLLSDEVANRPDLLNGCSQKSAAEITSGALSGSDLLAVEAVDLFLAIVGQEAGQMALRCLASGGVFIAGGIAPRLLKRLRPGGGALLEGFLLKKGRESFHKILSSTPVFVVLDEKVGLRGAAAYARRMLCD